jgi:hypothetical protein
MAATKAIRVPEKLVPLFKVISESFLSRCSEATKEAEESILKDLEQRYGSK